MKYKTGDKVRVKYKEGIEYSWYREGDIVTLHSQYSKENNNVKDHLKWWVTEENQHRGIHCRDFELVVEETPKRSYTSGTGWGFE